MNPRMKFWSTLCCAYRDYIYIYLLYIEIIGILKKNLAKKMKKKIKAVVEVKRRVQEWGACIIM